MKHFLIVVFCGFFGCLQAQKKAADLLVYNGTIYTVDDKFSVKDAMVIAGGKIVATGSVAQLRQTYAAKEEIDVKKKFVYPGFIDAHAHFLGYGLGLQTLDLNGTTSWEQIIEKVKAFGAANPTGWIIGRGWDQNDWKEKEFPGKEELDKLFPGRPVFLTRVDGHAAIANGFALGSVGPATKVPGGEIILENGQLTGVLLDNAIDLVASKIPAATVEQKRAALEKAAANCFAAGLTTIDDCGLSYDDVLVIEEMQKSGKLKMRL